MCVPQLVSTKRLSEVCEGRKLMGIVLEDCIRQDNPNLEQFHPYSVSLAIPGMAIAFNSGEDSIHSQREAKSKIAFMKYGHWGHQEGNEDLCFTMVEIYAVDPGSEVPPMPNSVEASGTRFGFWEINCWQRKYKVERKIGRLKFSQMSCCSSVLGLSMVRQKWVI